MDLKTGAALAALGTAAVLVLSGAPPRPPANRPGLAAAPKITQGALLVRNRDGVPSAECPLKAHRRQGRDHRLSRASSRHAGVREHCGRTDRSRLHLPAAADGRGGRHDDPRRQAHHRGSHQAARGSAGHLRRRRASRAAWPRCSTRSGPTSSPSRWPTSSRARRSRSRSATSSASDTKTALTVSASRWWSGRATFPAIRSASRRAAGPRTRIAFPMPRASRRMWRFRVRAPGTTSTSK